MSNESESICSKCGGAFPLSSFYKRKNGKPQSWCTPCKQLYDRSQDHRYLETRKANNNRRRDVARAWLVDTLTISTCVDCDESNSVVLEFDHLSDKVKSICDLVRDGASIRALKHEAAKCEVVCANCHAIRTHRRGNTFRWNAFMGVEQDGTVASS